MIFVFLMISVITLLILAESLSEPYKESRDLFDPIYLAEYIIWYAKHKLQTMVDKDKIIAILYLAQGVFLSEYGRPLFEEDFEVWERGPILPSVYFEYKIFGFAKIPPGPLWNQDTYDINLNNDELTTFNNIIEQAMPYAGYELIKTFSKQRPWRKNKIYLYSGQVRKIPKEDIKEFFDEYK